MQRLSPTQPLFHWSPASIRESILWNGLLIGQRNFVHKMQYDTDDGWRAPWICTGLSPMSAWDYIGTHFGQYDLWQIIRSPQDKIRCRKDGGKEIIEVRIHNNIPTTRLFYIGMRDSASYRVRKK